MASLKGVLPKPTRSYMYNIDNGHVLTDIKAPYRWVKRNLHNITRFSITETASHGAIVDVFHKNGMVLREHWDSCRLANQRYLRYEKLYNIPVSFYAYFPLYH